jgi:hypothetical protein
MMQLLYEPLPDSILVGGSAREILTDFRDWLKFGDLLKDDALENAEKLDFMRNWFVEIPDEMTAERFTGLRDFCVAKAMEPDRQAQEQDGLQKPPTFDFRLDSAFVIADFRRFYQMNLLTIPYLHWWEFLALLRALPDESQVFRRIAIRSADLSKITDKERKRAVMEAQMRIAIPFELDDYAIGAAFR